MDRQRLASEAKRWFQVASALGWKSFDPFDLLSSPYFFNIRTFSPLVARILIQIGKRTGGFTRRCLRIRPHEESKTLSDFLAAATIFASCGESWANNFVPMLSARLIDKAIPSQNGFGWGLEFPYVSRFVNVPARTPNVYQTVNAIDALIRAYELYENREALNAALQGCKFILYDLGFHKWGGFLWVRYWPEENVPIINVQASVASVFAHMGRITDDEQITSLSDHLIETVVNAQRSDGSWPYSADGKANFVDGFHTGFILQGLHEYLEHSGSTNADVRESYQKGLAYFKEHLITEDGMPRGMADGRVSSDGQTFAQCIQTLVICKTSVKDIIFAMNVWKNMLHFSPLKHVRSKKKRKPFVQLRWVVGPATLATAYLFASQPEDGILCSPMDIYHVPSN